MARRPLLADLLADRLAPQPVDERGPDDDGDHHRDEPRDQDSDHARACFSISAGMPSSPTARDALTRIASPGRGRRAISVDRVARRRRPVPVGVAARYARARLADRDDDLDPELVEERADLVVVAVALGPSSAISPRIATRRRPSARSARSSERRAHRGRVRVVRVVDDEAAARELAHLAAPAARGDPRRALLRALERQTERVVRRQRREDVLGEVPLGERQLERELAPPT